MNKCESESSRSVKVILSISCYFHRGLRVIHFPEKKEKYVRLQLYYIYFFIQPHRGWVQLLPLHPWEKARKYLDVKSIGRSNRELNRPPDETSQWRLQGSLTRLCHWTENCSILKLNSYVWRQQGQQWLQTHNTYKTTSHLTHNKHNLFWTNKKTQLSPKTGFVHTLLECVDQPEC